MDMEASMEALAETAAETGAEVVRNFATIGEVYEDGVSLIFDGEAEATEKHYLVNTSVIFHAGDRVRIFADAGTYVVEYVVGAPGSEDEVHGIPAGGTADQVLTKSSADDYDAAWADPAPSKTLENQGGPGGLYDYPAYTLQLKTGGYSGTAASEFYIRMGTSGTWHKIQLA